MGVTQSKCDAALPPVGAPPPASDFAATFETPEVVALKAPGQFERLHEDVKKLVNVNTFEGCKFELAKPLTPMFQTAHSLWLGGSHYPNANSHYKFSATVGDNERVCIASMDQYGTLEGQVYATMLKVFQGKFIFHLPSDPSGGLVAVADVDFNGANANAQLKLAHNVHGQKGALVGASYMQTISNSLAMGGEGSVSLDDPSATVSLAAKYAGLKHSATATLTKSTAPGNDALSLHYHRAVSPRVQLGTELMLSPQTLEAQVASGAEFSLKSSRVNLSIDGAGKMCSVVETALSPAAKLAFSGEVQFGARDETGKHADEFKFGYSLQIGQ
ncbi:eukaryotic porin/Tom40 [Pelagophyceae sp. CCMP2097]|nr:eukaryotic porin/Tom40 [Pelagophyceae sp. CCMP2097]